MDQASQVREKIDIVSLISEYITLKKMGRNFTTTCPFHNEKSPSFVVSPERQIWHCFGCGKGGDAYSFLMEYENLEFVEALRILAKKAGVTLKTTGSSFSTSKKESIFSLNKIAADYYSYVLLNHDVGKKALDYLINDRKLNEKLIKTFMIGFSPSSGEALSKYLISKKNQKPIELSEAGLSILKGPRTVDFFRGRIMFPLIDHRGNIVGFSGRSLGDNENSPKYINTRDTLVYQKGSTFFGLNQAKNEIKKNEFSIVVEGEFDVISSFKEGIGNTVALKGTAFTENQALLLSRFAPKVSLALDQDSAGMNALKRSIPVLEKRGLTITVINLDEKDPDDAIKDDPIKYKKAVKNQEDVYDFLINKLISEQDVESAAGKKKITDEMLPLISSINNEIVKEHHLKNLSKKIDISYDSLVKQMDRKGEKIQEDQLKRKIKQNRREVLEEYLLALVLQSQNPKEILSKVNDILVKYKFVIPSIGKIFKELSSVVKAKKYDIKSVGKNIPKELAPVFDKCYLMPLPSFSNDIKYEKEIIDVAKELKIIFLKNRITEISQDIKNKKGVVEIEKIQDEISNISSQLNAS